MAFNGSLKYVLLFWLICLWSNPAAQLLWTSIHVNPNSQVDLWTQEAKGCSCPWDKSNTQCACCASDGGCHCGKNAPNRCTQCGLEQHCYFMCNITIDSVKVKARSGKSFGQIKSPALEGPAVCWYTFVPTQTQRVEIQIYRLVDAGRHNGTSCVGGFLQLISNIELQHNPTDNQLCGINERYTPPAVFFADEGLATLLFQITDKTRRSLFLAYYSFTEKNSTDGTGYQPRGGTKLQNTDCDWLYQDFMCKKSNQCRLASPGYPGIYPPNRQCKYHIITSNENVRVRISFTALLLPPNCKTDFVAIYRGTTTSSPLLANVCGSQRKTFEFYGLNLLVEFSSGPQKPPFEYNGFVASLKFLEKITTTLPSLTTTITTKETTTATTPISVSTTISNNKISVVNETNEVSGCDLIVSGNNTRYGHFDTREHEWFPVCRLVFLGRQNDVVYVTFFNYRLRSPSCKSIIEVVDINEHKRNVLERICSPFVQQTKNEDKNFLSTGSNMIVTLKRSSVPLSTNEAEYLAGAYFFHDEELGGTMQPSGICDVKYNASPLGGTIDNPGEEDFYWNIDGPLSCRQQFVPAANQSVTLKIQSIEKMSIEPNCFTLCGDSGCQCVTNSSIKYVDHIIIVADNINIICLCGQFPKDGLPVSVRSWKPLVLIYTFAHYDWSNKGFKFRVTYNFHSDSICGGHIFRAHSGEITMKNISRPNYLNHFYYQICSWILHSNVERQLEVHISTQQTRPCSAWNLTIYDFMNNPKNRNLGDLLQVFCSKEHYVQKIFPYKPTVVVRLVALTRNSVQFILRWKSGVNRANTRLIGAPSPVPATTSSELAKSQYPGLIFLIIFLNRLFFIFICNS